MVTAAVAVTWLALGGQAARTVALVPAPPRAGGSGDQWQSGGDGLICRAVVRYDHASAPRRKDGSGGCLPPHLGFGVGATVYPLGYLHRNTNQCGTLQRAHSPAADVISFRLPKAPRVADRLSQRRATFRSG